MKVIGRDAMPRRMKLRWYCTSSGSQARVISSRRYSMAKAALIAYTELAALEYAPRGIRVNAVAPGRIATEMTADRQTSRPPKVQYDVVLHHVANADLAHGTRASDLGRGCCAHWALDLGAHPRRDRCRLRSRPVQRGGLRSDASRLRLVG